MVSLVYTSAHNQSLINATCIGESMERPVNTGMLCFTCSTKSGKCLTCDQNKWGLPFTDKCDYFTVSCDAALQQCLLNCEGIVLT